MKVTGVPLGTEVGDGVMLIPVITAAVMVRLTAGEVMPLIDAVTVVVPTAIPEATPVAAIVATAVLPVAHATWVVRSAVVASV